MFSSTGRKNSCSSQWLAKKKAAASCEPVPETAVTVTAFARLKPSKELPVQREGMERRTALGAADVQLGTVAPHLALGTWEARAEAVCFHAVINSSEELRKQLIASCVSNSLVLASPAVTVGSFIAKL